MTIIGELKEVGQVLKAADKIPEFQLILEIQEKLGNMQEEIADLKTENRKLKDELAIKKNLTFEKDSYWLKNEDELIGPFCSSCYDANSKLVRLHTTNSRRYYICPNCNQSVQT